MRQKRRPSRALLKRERRPPGQQQQQQSLRRRLWRAAPAIIFAVLLTVVLTRWSALGEVVPVMQDALMRLNAPDEESAVAVVDIDDGSYKSIFGEKSPLDAGRLRQLLEAVARAGPLVIGVDIKTDSESYRDFPAGPWAVPVVWLRETRERERAKEFSVTDRLLGRHVAPPEIEALKVLGRADEALLADSGVDRFVAEDNVVRLYQRRWKIAGGDTLPSFAWAILKKLPADRTDGLEDSTDALYVNYAGGARSPQRFRLTAAQVEEYARDEAGWRENSALKGKVVLLGGSYAESDLHDTPLGVMPGLYIHANIIETELRREGFRPLAAGVLVLLQFVEGVGFVTLFHFLSFRKAMLVSLLLIPALALCLSLLTSMSLARWTFFAPVLAGVLLHQTFDRFKGYREDLVARVFRRVGGAE